MPTKGPRVRGWCFTLSNYTEEEEKEVRKWDVRYIIYGREIAPKTKTPHLQGYVFFKLKKTLKAMKKLCERAHWEPQRGTCEQAIEYCKKEDTSPYQKGDPPKGAIRGCVSQWQQLNQDLNDGQSFDEIREKYPGCAIRYMSQIERVIDTVTTKNATDKMRAIMEKAKLRQWQEELVEALDEQDARKVLWVTDYVGNMGKTWLAKWILCMRDAFYTTGGKKADVQHAWKGQRYVVFDLSRQKQEYMNYDTIEEFKNGLICKSKYDSKTVVAEFCKVVVFANWDPDLSKLSQDRWELVCLNRPLPVSCDN